MQPADASVTHSSVASRIPPELFDNIIHESRENRSFLATFSLVCRAWIPASRSAFFQHRLVVLRPKNIGKFRFLMQSPHATLARYIRHLKICPMGKNNQLDMRRLPPFPSIETIDVGQTACIDFAKLAPRSLHDKFQALKYLDLYYFRFDSFSSIATILSSFPLLSHLGLNFISWSNNDMLSPAPGSMSSLRSLSILYGHIVNWLEWLLSFSTAPTLHTLRLGTNIGAMREDEGAIVNQFIQILGPSLKRLDINEYLEVDLSCSTELRTLHIWFSELPEFPSVKWIHALLARICSPHIENVNLQDYFPWGSRASLKRSQLRELDEVFSRLQFQNLQQVKFLEGADESMVYECMPLCHSRGILTFYPYLFYGNIHYWNWRCTWA